MQTTTTFDLDAAIAEAVTAHQATVTAHQATKAALERQRKDQQATMEAREIATLTEQLRQDLGDDLYDALAISVAYIKHSVQATAQIDGEDWTIGYTSRSTFWYIIQPRGPVADCTREHLRGLLLRLIAWQRQQRAEQQATQDQLEVERQARRADHARCQAQLNDVLATARAALWTWPAGQILTLFRWTWHLGDGNFEDGWATSDRLDAQSYIEVYTDATLRTLRLDLLAHQPVIERRTFENTEALPGELRERIRIDVPGIWWEYSEELYRTDPEATMSHDVGQIPIAWVQAQSTTASPT